MINNTLNDYGFFLNIKRNENETNDQYLERVLIAKTNMLNDSYDHDLIQFANMDNHFKSNAIEILFDQNKECIIEILNKTVHLKIDQYEETLNTDDERIYLLKDFKVFLESKGVIVFLNDDVKEYKTEFLFNFTNKIVRSAAIPNTYNFPKDVFVKGFYLSEVLNEIDNFDSLNNDKRQYFYNKDENKIVLSNDMFNTVLISYYGNLLSCNIAWSLNKIYESKDESFNSLTLDENKTLTSRGVALYNLINKSYSQMWG